MVIKLITILIWSSIFVQLLFISSEALIRGNESDRLSLLAFKAEIFDDPLGTLSSWTESLHFCEWAGVSCGRRHQRVTVLDLQSRQLSGKLSPHIGNLSFLRVLNLPNNSFHFNIPQEVGRLKRLQLLRLRDNLFSGEIPKSIALCSNLQELILSKNNLTGEIPKDLGILSKLQLLSISSNNLVGEIPTSLGNLSSLSRIAVEGNLLHGNIPNSFSQLKSLTFLAVGYNMLSGTIPSSIFNLSSIKFFSVKTNQIEGSLPPNLGYTLPNLQNFSFHHNKFSGQIPVTISNASNLLEFEISFNKVRGKVPSFATLSNLERLGLIGNDLGYGEVGDLNFLSSLVNCTNLEALGIGDNNFGGILPESIGNFSIKLRRLLLGRNPIHGRIPISIGNLVNLDTLNFERMKLSGTIPSSIGKLQNLNELSMQENELSGNLPSSLGNLTSLNLLYLMSNNLQGRIPPSLGECKSLLELDLSANNLSGPIPKSVLSLSSLALLLSFAGNQLTGSIPIEVGQLVNLVNLDFSENELSGEIPRTLGSCIGLVTLYLEGNLLQGNIGFLSSLRGAEFIDVSYNNLSGKIPTYFESFMFLQKLNLSFNGFEGEVPTKGVFANKSALSVIGNTRLCGGIPSLKLPRCTSNKKHKLSRTSRIAILVTGGFVALLTLIFLLFLVIFRQSKKGRSSIWGSSLGIISFFRVSYKQLFKATNGFSSANLIGAGSFGRVYKGILQEQRVAVKVLNLNTSKASKSFAAECQVLKNVRHRNLVKIITACSSIDFQGNDFKALVYELMVNMSLEEWLPGDDHREFQEQEKHLNLIQRINIAIDVASALDYLHNHCHIPIIHCDLKPSNVLLDQDLVAHVGDFGLARLLPDPSRPFSSNHSSSFGIPGSIGYVAPEYGMGGEVSTSGDVYSYGVLLMEMFTGKRPTSDMFRDDMNLQNFVAMALPQRVKEILDPMLLLGEEDNSRNNDRNTQNQLIEESLNAIFKIGLACASEQPSERMNISNVVVELCRIRDALLRGNAQEAYTVR